MSREGLDICEECGPKQYENAMYCVRRPRVVTVVDNRDGQKREWRAPLALLTAVAAIFNRSSKYQMELCRIMLNADVSVFGVLLDDRHLRNRVPRCCVNCKLAL